MKTKQRSTAKKVAFLGALLAILVASFALPAAALAADDGAYYLTTDGSRVSTSPGDAWSKAQSNGTGMGLTRDWTLSDRLCLDEGKKVYVELNGHVIDRNRSSYTTNGEVFWVEKNAKLTVYGGTKDDPAAGGDISHNVTAWVTDSAKEATKTTRTVYGGVLTGGYSSAHAGGIEMRENATVELRYVTVCGNRAEQNWGSDGYGGGIHMARDFGKLTLDHSSVVYNYAYNEGGGVFVNGGAGRECADYCQIRMTHSHVDYNGCEDNGAGLSVRGEHFLLTGDAKRYEAREKMPNEDVWRQMAFNGKNGKTTQGSTIANNVVWDSDTGGGGGGVYLWNDCGNVDGVNVVCNKVLLGGSGGGIYAQEEEDVVSNCNIACNSVETERIGGVTYGGEGGGVYVNNDLTTISDCTIASNVAVVAGGGVWVDGMVDLSVGGTLVVQGNRLTNNTENNIFLQKDTGSNAYLVSAGLGPKSLLGVTLDSGHVDRVACGSTRTFLGNNPGDTLDQRMFASDGNAKYLYWCSETNPWYDESIKIEKNIPHSDFNYRWIVAVDPSKVPTGYTPSAGAEVKEFTPDAGSRLKRVGSYEVGGTDYGLYQGVFGTPSYDGGAGDIEVGYCYSDGFFVGNPKEYNEHLATLSCALALSVGNSSIGNEGEARGLYNTAGDGSKFYAAKAINGISFMSDLGVKAEDIFVHENYRVQPQANSMGVIIGSKKIGNKTLVIVGTRGIAYEREWAGNVTLGSEGEAQGFSAAATIAFDAVQDYLAAHNIDGTSSNTLFWLSGYSRGGATSNLTAKRIVDAYDNGGERTFAYSMEAPKGGMDAAEKQGCDYTSIHNVVNSEDLVPYVAPTEMGFKRYGVDHYVPGTNAGAVERKVDQVQLYDAAGNPTRTITVTTYRDNAPSKDASMIAEMVRQLSAVNGAIIYDNYFQEATINFLGNTLYGSNVMSLIDEVHELSAKYSSAEAYLPVFMGDLLNTGFNYATKGTSRTNDYRRFYSSEVLTGDVSFQEAVNTLLGIAFSLEPSELNGLMEVLGGIMNRVDSNGLYFDLFINGDDEWSEYDSYENIAKGKLNTLADGLWEAVSTRDEQKGYKSLYDVLDRRKVEQIKAVWKPLVFPVLYWAHFDYKQNDSNLLGTLAYNAPRIMMNHYCEVTLSYLRAHDDLYKNGANDSYKSFTVAQDVAAATLAVDVSRVADGGTSTTETLHKKDLNQPIELVTSKDTLRFYAEADDNAMVFYRLGKKDDWHACEDLLSFADVMKAGLYETASDGVATAQVDVRVVDSHTRGVESTTVQLEYKAVGTLVVGSYEYQGQTSRFATHEQKMPVDSTLELKASELITIPSSTGRTGLLDHWQVKLRGSNGKYKVVTNTQELRKLCGEGFDPSSQNTSITMMQEVTLRVSPVLREFTPITKVKVSPCGGDLVAPKVRLIFNDDAMLRDEPVTWDYAYDTAEGKTYLGELTLHADDLSPSFGDDDEQPGTGLWFREDTNLTRVEGDGGLRIDDVELSNGTWRLKLIVTAPEDEVWTLNVVELNVARNANMGMATYYVANANKNPDYRPAVTDYAGYQFVGWSQDVQVDEASRTKELVAWYRPIAEKITLTVDHGPIAGKEMPVARSISIVANWERYEYDVADNSASEWRAAGSQDYSSEQSVAEPDVAYEVRYGLHLRSEVPEGGNTSDMPPVSFALDPDCAVSVVDEAGEPVAVSTTRASDTTGEGDYPLTFHVGYLPARRPVTEVGDVGRVVLENGVSEDQIFDALAGLEVPVQVDGLEGAHVYTKRPSSLGLVAYAPTSIHAQLLHVPCELTSDEYDLDGNNTIRVQVFVGAAPSAQMPSMLPNGGTHSGVVRVHLSHPDDASSIYYAVKAVPKQGEGDGEDPAEAPSFRADEYVFLNDGEDVVLGAEYVGQRVYVSAFAMEDGFNGSPAITRGFEVMTAFDQVPYADESGAAQEPALCRRLTSDDSNYTYWSDKDGGWLAACEDLVVNGRVRVNGNVSLILCDGATLQVPAGIDVPEGSSLTIWSQEAANGTLIAGSMADEGAQGKMPVDSAGIGSMGGAPAGTVVIRGGNVTGQGNGGGAGIGGSLDGACTVSIKGGVVRATGGEGAPGIGGPDEASVVNLSWAKATDSIAASSFSAVGDLELEKDFRFSDGTGSVSIDELRASANKTLVPLVHEHAFEYTAIGNTLNAVCKAPRCSLEGNAVSVRILADEATYDGSAHEASVDGLEGFVQVTGVDVGQIAYERDGAPVDAPVDAGTYKASVSLGGAKASVDLVVRKAVWEHGSAQTSCALGTEGTLSLADCLAPGGMAEALRITDESGILEGEPRLADGVLSFAMRPADEAQAGVTAMIEVPVVGASNYEDYVIQVQIMATEAPQEDPTWFEPSYVWSADEQSVTAVRVRRDDPSNRESETTQVQEQVTREPTCEQEGERTLTATFQNEAFATQTKTEVIPATGHEWSEWARTTEATEEQNGEETRVCVHDSTHTQTRQIPALSHNHTFEEVARVEPTCGAEGSSGYVRCTECGARFASAEEPVQLNDEDITIRATGEHAFGEPSYSWDKNSSVVTASRKCEVCGHEELEQAVSEVQTTVEPTVDTPGERTYTASFSNSAFEAQTRTEQIDALVGVTLSFDANGGTGTMEPAVVATGTSYELPDCGFEPPANMTFDAWKVGETTYAAHTKIAADENKTVVATWKAKGPSFKTVSLVLSGQIGVNFYLDLPTIDGVNWENSSMTFVVNGVEQVVPFSKSSKNADNTLYRFTCYVSSIQMAEKILATFHYGDGQAIVKDDVSVENYIKAFDEEVQKDPTKYDQQTTKLVHALADYGYFAQPYLSEQNHWELGKKYARMLQHYNDSLDTDVTRNAVGGYAIQKTINGSDITGTTCSLDLESSTALQVYLTVKEGTQVTCDAHEYKTTKLSDTRWRIRIPNIPAHRLGETFTVSGSAGGTRFEIGISVMAYVNLATGAKALSSNGVAAMCALERYWSAAMACV